jgi:hypothetical protein
MVLLSSPIGPSLEVDGLVIFDPELAESQA